MASSTTVTAAGTALTGVQKCAVLLIALGDQISADLLKRMTDEEIQAVSNAIATLPAISSEQAQAVLEEFRNVTAEASQVGRGGVDYAKRILTNAFGPEGSKKHLDRLPSGPGKD